MRAKAGVTAIAGIAMMALSSCGDSDGAPRLMNIQSTDGPDEFAIVPPKPLEMPQNLADLPAPTPGGANRTDQRPLDDAVIALGGNPAAGSSPATDGTLLAHAGRYGSESGIRQTLATEDLGWRRENKGRILERIFGVNSYYRAYEDQSLDQQSELARWRKAGARTSSAPPAPTKD